jgi:hypothetical protein
MMSTASSRRSTDRRSRLRAQSGQATFEFVLAVIFIIVSLSALYQALHFELDAFNKISLLRFRVMDEAHENQHNQDKSFPSESMDFRPVHQLTPVLLMTQDIDPMLQYGPKSFRYRKGTKYAEPFPISSLPESEWGIFGLIQVSGDYSESGFKFRRTIAPLAPVFIVQYPDPNDQ